jgi:hypothetical protein
MQPDPVPLSVAFADLFDGLGTDEINYSAAAQQLSGRPVAIDGFLTHAHGPNAAMLLVDQPGICPDCAPAPAAVITLVRARRLPQSEELPVRVVGRLDYGFRIDEGMASFLRIEEAAIAPLEYTT